jgi:hypothetical protein
MNPDSLYATGVRPIMDAHLKKESEKVRDYKEYWSASSVGYCYRLNILKRAKVPPVPEILESKERMQRVFSAGHIFHNWAQELTREAGISLSQEDELIDKKLMVKGHYDDIVQIGDKQILIDYKTVNSKAFNYPYEMKSTHRLQLGTYMYMLNKSKNPILEARIVEIEKDALRMREGQLLWDQQLAHDVEEYWTNLNIYWDQFKQTRTLPECKCSEMVGAWMAKRSKDGRIFNDYFLNGKPCSEEWWQMNKHNVETK